MLGFLVARLAWLGYKKPCPPLRLQKQHMTASCKRGRGIFLVILFVGMGFVGGFATKTLRCKLTSQALPSRSSASALPQSHGTQGAAPVALTPPFNNIPSSLSLTEMKQAVVAQKIAIENLVGVVTALLHAPTSFVLSSNKVTKARVDAAIKVLTAEKSTLTKFSNEQKDIYMHARKLLSKSVKDVLSIQNKVNGTVSEPSDLTDINFYFQYVHKQIFGGIRYLNEMEAVRVQLESHLEAQQNELTALSKAVTDLHVQPTGSSMHISQDRTNALKQAQAAVQTTTQNLNQALQKLGEKVPTTPLAQ